MAFSQGEITRRQAELDAIRNEINKFETLINERQRKERATLELLDAYDRKAGLVHSLIARLRSAEQSLQQEIDSTKVDLAKLEKQLDFLRKHYASYVASVYKSGRVHDLELLLTARSVNQFYIRAEYLRRFTDQRQRDAAKITLKKEEVGNTEAALQENLAEQRRVLAEKAAEEDRLAMLIADRKDILQHIRKDKRSLQREIERKRKAAKELEGLIAGLIEVERIRKEKEAADVSQGKIPEPIAAGRFEARRGRLRWPVTGGAVVARFGNHTHPTLRTVTENPGIDIGVQAGAPVVAVAGGKVARIWWLVSFGNLVILDHTGGYRTIYAHLAEIKVAEGQQLQEGDVIGTSGETLDGPRIHFELWKDREKQNPESWLARR